MAAVVAEAAPLPKTVRDAALAEADKLSVEEALLDTAGGLVSKQAQ